MRIHERHLLAAFLTTVVWLAPAAVSAADAELAAVALGNGGELHAAAAGTYGELFPEGDALDGATPVLALTVEAAGEEPTAGIVPGTEDGAVERDPQVLYDRRTSRVMVLWKSDVEGATHVRFATFDGEEWSEVGALSDSGEPIAFAADPLIATTRDAFDVELEGGERHGASRDVFHLVWQTEGESPLTRYAPITFVDGVYNGSSQVFDLSESLLLAVAPPGEGEEETETPEVALPAGLERALSLAPGGDGLSLSVTFASAASGRVGTVEITTLPLVLEQLGTMVRRQIDELADLYDPEDLSSFHDGFRASVVIIGSILGINPATVDYSAHGAGAWILDQGGEYGWSGFGDFGDDLGEVTVDLASEVETSVATDPSNPGEPITRIDLSNFLTGGEDAPGIFELRVHSARPFPEIGGAEAALHASEDGRDLLASWVDEEEGVLYWTESRQAVDGGAWSEVRSLTLSEAMSAERGRRLLEKHLR